MNFLLNNDVLMELYLLQEQLKGDVMKIALVNAQTINNKMREMYGYHENLGLGLIHACIEKEEGCNVVSYDLRIQRLNEYEMAEIILEEKFNVVAFSVNYATMESAVLIAQLVKFHYSDVYIVFGGEHATYLDVEILERYSFVNAVVRGEGEQTFIELIKCLEDGKDLKSVAGITYSEDGKIIQNENRIPISNLDSIPFASKQLVKLAIKNNVPIEIGILAQRGCPFTCSFCNAYKFFSNEFGIGQTRTRTPENVVLEMKQLYPYFRDNHKMILHFYDATFITKSKKSREWVEKFIDLLEKSAIRIPFDAFIRADSFDFDKQEDINLIERLKGVGFIGTYLGLEAGDDEVLELYNKKVHTNDSHYTIEKLYNMGIEGSTNGVICFHQAVSLKEVKNTVSFLKSIGFCSLWNVSSRAETLPGINLSKDMQLEERRNLWDVQNYSFYSKEVEEIYDIILFIKENFFVAQYEDYLIRKLREQVKLEIFYKNTQESYEIREKLEKSIHTLQNLTYCFMIELIEKLENGEQTNRNIYKGEIIKYVNDLFIALSNIANQFAEFL